MTITIMSSPSTKLARVYHLCVHISGNIHLRNDYNNNVISFNQVSPKLRRIVIFHNSVAALMSKMSSLPTNKTNYLFFLKKRIRSKSTWDGIRRNSMWVIMFVLFLVIVINFVDSYETIYLVLCLPWQTLL